MHPGMSAMLDADIVINSTDATTGEPITVTVHGEDATARPRHHRRVRWWPACGGPVG